MIDEARTLELFGYTSDGLAPQSSKPIVAVCEECGKYRVTRKQHYRAICRSCVQKGKKHTEESKRKMSEAVNGRTHTEETCHKISESTRGHVVANETRRKQSATRRGIEYDDWESYATSSPYCPKFNDACKESNREKYGRRCFLTGIPESENVQKLSVHHCDMNKQQGCDGHRWRLVPLCKGWHGRTHNDVWIARIQYLLDNVWTR